MSPLFCGPSPGLVEREWGKGGCPFGRLRPGVTRVAGPGSPRGGRSFPLTAVVPIPVSHRPAPRLFGVTSDPTGVCPDRRPRQMGTSRPSAHPHPSDLRGPASGSDGRDPKRWGTQRTSRQFLSRGPKKTQGTPRGVEVPLLRGL